MAYTGKKRKQEALLIALLQADTIAEAAQITGVSEATCYNYLKDEGFKSKYREAKKAALNLAIKNLQYNSNAAADTFFDVMQNSNSDTARVMAAKALLEYSFKGLEVEDIQESIEAIERRLQEYEKYRAG